MAPLCLDLCQARGSFPASQEQAFELVLSKNVTHHNGLGRLSVGTSGSSVQYPPLANFNLSPN